MILIYQFLNYVNLLIVFVLVKLQQAFLSFVELVQLEHVEPDCVGEGLLHCKGAL